MGFLATAEGEGGSFEIVPEGTRIARCIQVIDLGHQYSEYYNKVKHKILLAWELPSVSHAEGARIGEPMLVFKRYTLSLHENSNLRADLESWRGRAFTEEELEGFDVLKVLDHPCQVSITHRKEGKNTWADVKSVTSLGEGQPVMDRFHPLLSFDVDAPDMTVFEGFSENLQRTIRNSEEWKNKATHATPGPTAQPSNGAQPPPNVPPEVAVVFPDAKVTSTLPPSDDDLPF
jgi:hypothetical protein